MGKGEVKGIARNSGKPNIDEQAPRKRGRPALTPEEKAKREAERQNAPEYFSVAPYFIAANCKVEKVFSTHDRSVSVTVITSKDDNNEFLLVERGGAMALYTDSITAKRSLGGMLKLMKEAELDVDMD